MKRLNTILLCFMLTIILVACNQKSSNSEGANSTEEQSGQGENDASVDEDISMHISAIQLTDDEKRIWELFTDRSSSNIYSYTVDDQVKSVAIQCYQLSKDNDFNWVEIDNIFIEADNLEGRGLIVINITNDIEMIIRNGGTICISNLAYSEYLPDNECASSVIWQSGADITYNDEIPLGMLVTVKDDRLIQPRILRDFNEPEKLVEYDSVIAFTACFSTSEKLEP
ncbi:MAG: hypothetical protein ACRC3H_06630 [Lachnospiraceae bacterium]